MTEFLSEENILLHQSYMRNLKLKYSILEKSIEGIKGKKMSQILRMRIHGRDAKEILDLLPEIELHELYFSSFANKKNSSSSAVRLKYKSEGAFLNELYRLGMSIDHGFVIANFRMNRIETFVLNDFTAAFTLGAPMLALDVCEHAYFSDYGFDKNSYLINALTYLDLGKIDSYFAGAD